MNEKITQYVEQITLMEQNQSVNDDIITFMREMLEDLQTTNEQNINLRKLVLKASSQQNKMSTKLRDALYE